MLKQIINTRIVIIFLESVFYSKLISHQFSSRAALHQPTLQAVNKMEGGQK